MARSYLIVVALVLVLTLEPRAQGQQITCPTITCPSISCPIISCPTNPANNNFGSSLGASSGGSSFGSHGSYSTPPITIPPVIIPPLSPLCPNYNYCPGITCSMVSCSGGQIGGSGINNPGATTGYPGQGPNVGGFPGSGYPTSGSSNNNNAGFPGSGSGFPSSSGSSNYPPILSGEFFNYTGHYQSASNDSKNLDEFLNVLGLNFLARPKLIQAGQELFITPDKSAPGSYHVKNSFTAVGDTYYSFRDGAEFNEQRLYDSKNVRTIINVRGNRWMQSQFGAPEVTVMWEFGVPSPKELRITTTVNGVSTVRRFVKKN